MKKLIALALASIFLVGCTPPEVWKTNQELRQQLFLSCMQALPAGPKETVYNDWDEVVKECDSVAYYQARYCAKNCK